MDAEVHDKKEPNSTENMRLILRHPSQELKTQHSMKLISQLRSKY